MKITQLQIHNFNAIGSATLRLDGQGLVLIEGVNLFDSSAKSNGAGKSSIVDALCWAIYGETAREESGDAVVNDRAKKDCRVAVVVEDGATQYRIARHRKHSVHKNQTVVEVSTDGGSTWSDVSKATEKDTQDYLIAVMGSTLPVFMASIYAGQEAMPDLPKMTDKQLKLIVEEAAGVARLEGAYRIASSKVNDLKVKLPAVKARAETLEANIARQKVDVAAAKDRVTIFEDGRAGRRAAFVDESDTVRKALIKVVTTLKEAGESVKAARSAEIAATLADHGKMLAVLRGHAEAVSVAKNAEARHRSNVAILAEQARRIKGELDNAAEEMKKPCSECGKPHTEDELDEFKRHLTTRLRDAVQKAKDAQADAPALAAKTAAAQKTHDEYAATVPDVSVLAAEQADLGRALSEIAALKSKIGLMQAGMKRATDAADAAMTEPNPHSAAVASAEKRLTDLETERATVAEEVRMVTESLEVAENVAKVFSPAGVRAHILDTVTPFLNDRTADYLSALSDGNITAVWTTLGKTTKGEVREKFNIDVQNDKGAKSFKGLSGGEKRKVRLATMLALQDLVASRASKPIDLYIGDEIDDALDTAGLERLMVILERKARERGTVLVVSHADLRDWIDNVCTVTKQTTGISDITGALVA
ncbi:AAA family ATPase [Achromobacter sp. AGC39]